MDFYITDKDRYDMMYLSDKCSFDFEIGSENDFEIGIPVSLYDSEIYEKGHYIYCDGTEYGGRIEGIKSDTSDGIVKIYGETFRGMLKDKVVEPPTGEAYLYVSGDLTNCLKALLGGQYTDVFKVSDTLTGVSVSNYKINRYDYILNAMESLLEPKGYRLDISVINEEETFFVELSAKLNEVDDEISQDYDFNFSIDKKILKYNYMIALGGGQLEKRTVLYLHQKGDGTVEQVSEIPNGDDIRVYKYDYSSSDSTGNDTELIDSATKKFNEINESDSQTMTISDGSQIELELGSVVSGRDYVTGITIQEPVTKKILKVRNGIPTISYGIGVDK
nr:MAG TPA: hypothetical protein [Caudoviricetes sp.]